MATPATDTGKFNDPLGIVRDGLNPDVDARRKNIDKLEAQAKADGDEFMLEICRESREALDHSH